MKILYLIYSRSHASGGHFHSLDQISREMASQHEVFVVIIGKESPILKKNPAFYATFPFSKNFGEANQFFKNTLSKTQADIVHCFDVESYNVALILPAFSQAGIVLTKCGGPNPKRSRWQYADNIVLFSAENYNWFKSNKRYRSSNLYLIPNRVGKLTFLPDSLRSEQKTANNFNFVRIQRIGAYRKTIMDTFRMIELLRERHPVHLHLIGTVQSKEEYEFLLREVETRKLPVTFVTDERAAKASDLLYLADAVIGTGRSFMEASSLGLPVLAPVKSGDFPVLVSESNFDGFLSNNFSERTPSPAKSAEAYEQIERMVSDPSYHRRVAAVSRELFDTYFGTEKILAQYTHVYNSALTRRPNRAYLLIMNLPYILKFVFGRT